MVKSVCPSHGMLLAMVTLSVACAGGEPDSSESSDLLPLDPRAALVIDAAAFEDAPVLTVAEPVAVLGGGDAGLVLGSVASARSVDSATIAIADEQAMEILLVDISDQSVRRLGGLGEGPGEFQFLRFLGTHGSSLSAYDHALDRVTVFDLESGEIESWSGARTTACQLRPDARSCSPVGLVGRDGLVVQARTDGGAATRDFQMVPGGPSWSIVSLPTGPVELAEISLGDRAMGLVRDDGALLGVAIFRRAYGGSPVVAAAHETIVSTRTDSAVIRRWGADGDELPGIQLRLPMEAVDAEDLEQLRQLEWPTPDYTSAAGLWLDEMEPGSYRPLIGEQVFLDQHGAIWVSEFVQAEARDHAPPAWWFRIDEGSVSGRLQLPASAEILEFGTTHILLLETDDLGRQSVAVRPLLPTARQNS